MDESVKLDARGRVVLPDGWLERWGVKPGDAVTLRLEAGCLRVMPRRVLISAFVGRYALPVLPTKPPVSKTETTGSNAAVSEVETTAVSASPNEAAVSVGAVEHGA